MQTLINITEKDGSRVCSARELYEKLGYNSSNWAKWFQKNIVTNDFAIENVDYTILVLSTSKQKRGNFGKDFALTLDFAKKLSMLARTKNGEKVRDYFIEIEKRAKKPMDLLDVMASSIAMLKAQKEKLSAFDKRLLQIEAKTTTRPECFTIAGYATLNNIQMPLRLASSLGRKASKICKKLGIIPDEIPDPRFGRVKSYPKKILEQVFETSLV